MVSPVRAQPHIWPSASVAPAAVPPRAPIKPIPRRVDNEGGVTAPWRSVGEIVSPLLFRPSYRSMDAEEVRDPQGETIEGKSVLTNLLTGLLQILFSPFAVIVGLVAICRGRWQDGLVTTFLGPIVDVFAGLKDIFIDAPTHFARIFSNNDRTDP